ncbi:hypothetical protein ACHAWF_015178 [Thalassiosira exigua]
MAARVSGDPSPSPLPDLDRSPASRNNGGLTNRKKTLRGSSQRSPPRKYNNSAADNNVKGKGRRFDLRYVLAMVACSMQLLFRGGRLAAKGQKKLQQKQKLSTSGVPAKESKKKRAVASPDTQGLDKMGGAVGPCHYNYPDKEEPPKGWTEDIDSYFRRDSHADRDAAFVSCLAELDPSEVNDEMLVDAARLGLTGAATVLYQKFGLDPLNVPPAAVGKKKRVPEARLFNALQEAILGGYAEMIPVLSGGDYDEVIDGYGRTILDYVRARGSPIRPSQAKNVMMMENVEDEGQPKQRRESQKKEEQQKFESGWDETSANKYDTVCDIDEIHDDAYMTREVFFKEYYSMGRPFILRNHVPVEGLKPFAKSYPYWDPTENLKVGSMAYPSLTDQSYCRKRMTLTELEKGKKCKEMPDKYMVHAWHPSDKDFDELYAAGNGNVFSKPYGWRKISEWFGEVNTGFSDDGMGWQIFLGSDGSGATYHWHQAAINALYVGVKEWVLAPPAHRGFTGMQAQDTKPLLDDDLTVRCTQYPGDVIFFPKYLTINHGFTIGAAVILDDDYQRYALRDAAQGEARETIAPRALAFRSQAAKAEHASKSHASYLPFLFIHIPKTGGNIINMLSNYCVDEYYTDHWGNDPPHRSFHATAHSYIDHYGREAYDQAFTFTVVRHPLAKQVSNFFFLAEQCRRNTNSCKERLTPIEVDGVPVVSLPGKKKIEIFHDWIAALYKKYPPGSPGHYLFGNKGHGNEEYGTFSATQLSWIVDEEGSIAVDLILKLEDLSGNPFLLSDYIPCLQGAKMEKRNKTPKYPDFMRFAENERTKKIMHEVYAEDFETFGYTL